MVSPIDLSVALLTAGVSGGALNQPQGGPGGIQGAQGVALVNPSPCAGSVGGCPGGPAGPLGVPLIKLMPGVRECLTAEFMPALRAGLAYESALARGNREINSVGRDRRRFSRQGAFPPRVHRDRCEKRGPGAGRHRRVPA
jgi:hypothetical protein